MYRLFIYMIMVTVLVISCNNNENTLSDTELNSNSIKVKDILINRTSNFNHTENKNISMFNGYLNKEYFYDLKSEAHLNGEKFYIYSNNLPKGLELNEDTGLISGKPIENGNFKFEIAIKTDEDEPLIIRPINISIDDNIQFYKDVRSFIDLSKTDKSTTINHNDVINLVSSPVKNFFQFYQEGINEVRVCQQGYLKLSGGDCSFTSDFSNNDIIAPFADPEITMGSDSHIYYQIRGLQPRRMLLVQFENMHRTTDPKARQNFEVIIYENSNRIAFLYGLSSSYSDNTQKHLGTNAIIGLYSPNKQYIISPEDENTQPKPIIFDGTIISFKAPDLNFDQYRKSLDTNLVSDFIDISRYLEETEDCTESSQCKLTDLCKSGKCSAKLLTIPLMYDGAKKVELPFYFNFYGDSFNEVKVHENGYLFFDSENYNFYSQKPSKDVAMPVNEIGLDNVIAPLFSDIDLKSVRGGNILYNVVGSFPSRKAIFLYDKIRILDSSNNEPHICTFEVVLYETSNIIEFIYGTNNGSSFCNGIASSIGIKKDSSDYISVISNNPVLKQGKSIVFIPNDYLANSYTWSGIGNEFRNSNTTNGVNGKFSKVAYQWKLIDDQPKTEFVRYEQTITPTNEWIDTSAGTVLPLSNDDYEPVSATAGATFKFYGQPRTTFYVQSNGGITVEPESMYWKEPDNINYDAAPGHPNQGMFLYWNDLHLVSTTKIRSLQTNKNNQDVLVIEWKDIRRINQNKQVGWYTFQAQIYEDGQMYFCYNNMDNGASSDDLSYISGIRYDKDDNIANNNNLQNLVSTSKCVSYTPVYKYPPNHIIATRSTVSNEDAGEENVAIGFPYNFMGNTFNNITIGSNGLAKFEDNLNTQILGTNKKLSSINAYDNSLALFWDDLDPRANTSPASGIFYTTIGNAPNREFILSYNAVPHGDVGGASRISTQLIIRENSPNILYCYGDLSGSYHTGDSATIGVRKLKTNYTQLSYNTSVLSSNECYEWTPPSPDYIEARNLFTGETNADFIDIPIEHPGFGAGEYLEKLYGDKPYTIYDLTSQNYKFSFKGREYNQLFVDSTGAVSFGNDNDAAIVTAPMWGNIFYQTDILNKSHISLQTPYENIENDFMWIANAGGNSLSKINTHDGTVTGPFPVGKSPSRTAVGFDGSVWVGNRNSYNVTKLDRDGNKICTVNLVNNCAPRALALDKDENVWVGCGAWKNKSPDGRVYKIRDNHNQSGNRCDILDIRANGDTSSDLSFKGHENYGHYGFAIDKHGILWSSPGTHNDTHSYFLRIDTNKTPNDAGFYKRFRGYSTDAYAVGSKWESRGGVTNGNDGTPFYYYGIAIDLNGDLWLGNWGHTSKDRAITRAHYDEVNDKLIFENFSSYGGEDVGYSRGVAIDANGYIYIAYSGLRDKYWRNAGWYNGKWSEAKWVYFVNGDGAASAVGKFASDGTAVALFHINNNTGPEGANDCKMPTGIGVDGDGDVWANCLGSSKSEELDVNTGKELKSLPTGNSPYCYSDNTGFNLRNIVTDIKPEKYYAGITNYVAYPNEANCEYRSRKLVVEWRDVRLFTETNHGYTEASFEIIFDNGYRYKCDLSSVQSIHPVKIEFVYGAIQGNKYSQKTGGDSMITFKSIYSDYNHVFGDQDAGTINSGSKFVITSER